MLPLRNALLLFGAALIAVGSAEITSRVDDAIRYGVPFWRTPDRERDLTMRDSLGLRGRPNGRYQKWILNRYGFRSPPMSALPRAGCPRIMILGASETLGYYESPGQEYPAQLADSLRRRTACVEVVNAAVAGLSLPGVQELWENWASRFRPAVVVVYPSPAFYLSTRGPSAPAPVRSSPVSQDRRPWRPRLWQRAKDAFEYPEFIQRRRLAAALVAATAGRDSTWFFREVPQDRLERYRADL
ncbi:MAG TPA: hypothetical protein VNH46_14090, partial [Gemmatimonadales bacterium]|nr:hypothetical protein [Gemmatimonadales bacterium]